MSIPYRRPALVVASLLLGACTVMPTGPSVMVLPGTGQSIERFRDDERACRQDAHIQIGGKTAGQAARESAVTTAVVGTAVGAVAGAAIGGNQGAAVGAGVGLVAGSAIGADSARSSGYGTQRQYDKAASRAALLHPARLFQATPAVCACWSAQ